MQLKKIVDFLFEVGILSKTPRSGFYFLGSGSQSVAEHINRVTFIGYVLTTMTSTADQSRVIKMCLFHDLPEARISDLNYVHQKYVEVHEDRAVIDVAESLPFGEEIKSLINERNAGKTTEALLAKDADQLEWIMSLKEQVDIGNTRAESWIPSAVKRLKTDAAKQLAEIITKTPSDDWWFADKENSWWINRNRHH